jgi:hypothetical protein
MLWSMIQLLRLLCGALIGLFRSNARREAEILVLRHQINLLRRKSCRQIVWLGVTAQPTAEWIARQLTEAYAWSAAPRYIVRDRDALSTAPFSYAAFRRWAFVTGRPRRDRHGKTDVRNG